ncbi:energy-coupling factor transporter transmembrane protein EcfT [Slackia isoflavoniconvertens]|nr:energy-coupling factor transporter transmembrane protein EcfT [Slackia isoflavoniconvertens]
MNKIVQRGRAFVAMLVGLFRHASVLACAMEARCYGALGVRTCLHGEQRVGPRSVALVAAFSVFCIFMGVLL